MIFLQILRLLAVMVLAFGAGKLASKLKMPVILGWLIAGMVLGPHALNLLDQQTLDAAWFGSVEHLLECVAGLIIGTELLWKKQCRAADPGHHRDRIAGHLCSGQPGVCLRVPHHGRAGLSGVFVRRHRAGHSARALAFHCERAEDQRPGDPHPHAHGRAG